MIFYISTAIIDKKNAIICSNAAKKKHLKVYISNVCEKEYLKTHYTVQIS